MKMKLKVKAILLIVLISLLIGASGVIIFNKSMSDITIKEYESRSIDLAAAVAQYVDPEDVRTLRDNVLEIYDASDEIVLSDEWGSPEWEAYVAQYAEIEKTKEFNSLREQIRKVQDVISVDCAYLTWYDSVNGRYLYLVDAAYEEVCAPGVTDPLYFDDPEIIAHLDEIFPPNITNTEEYGYILSTGMPIHTDNGELVGYANIDITRI